MYPHRIRLRGPWQSQPLSAAATEGQRFRRRFGYPGRIDAYERVWLTLAGIAGMAEVHLNDHPLGRREGPAAFEFDVTALLRPRNELVVDVIGATSGSWQGEAALEVRCTAFLRNLRRAALRRGERVELRVDGEIVGEAERPLELYVVAGRSTMAYQVVTPSREGRPFEIVVPDLDAEALRESPVVKVDLVNGASIWYTSEAEVCLETSSNQAD